MKIFFGDQAMVARASAFRKVKFCEALKTMEDLDLCVRLFFGVDEDSAAHTSYSALSRGSGRKGKGGVQRYKWRGTKFVYLNRCAHTSGRRIDEWGVAKSLKLFLVLSLSYAFKASPQSLNELANKVYSEVR